MTPNRCALCISIHGPVLALNGDDLLGREAWRSI
jgi:AhpD family alkylhydroperoxidase